MKTVKLSEICDIQSGGTPSRSNPEYWNGSIPWVKIGDFSNKFINCTEERITEKGLQESSAKIFPKGTILFSIFATIGAVAVLNIEACTNQAIAGLTLKDDTIGKDYLYYFLSSLKSRVNDMGRGAAQNNINLSMLRKMEIPVYSKTKQERISITLEKVQHVIRTNERQLSELDNLIKARFVEMFGTFPENPMRWKTGRIRDVVSDVRYGSSRPAVDGGRYPYLRMNNITYGGELDLADIKQIDVPDNELDKCSVHRGDVLFNRTNSRELVGKTCVYNRDDMMVLAGFVIRVRLNDLMLPEFLSAFLNTDFSKTMLLGMCKGAIGQANINAQEMQGIRIYIPPIDLQEKFVMFKDQVDKSKSVIQKSLDETRLLFDSLMQQYFG